MFGLGKKKGPQEVSLNSGEYSFDVEPEQNILDAALKAGVAFPHDCRVGSCGSCACKLTDGKIQATADFSYVLDGKQLDDGMILACQSRAKTPVSIDVSIDGEAKVSATKKYNGSVLDGRDIITVQVKDAMFKFYITANIKIRAKRRFNEYRSLKKNITYNEVLKTLRIRDKSDKQRKHGPLKKTKDSILINTTKLSKKACFKKIKAIIDNKLYN